MSPEALERRAAEEALRRRQAQAALSLEIELGIKKDGPLNYILASAFNEAVDALQKLVEVDPIKVDEIRKLQNDIKRYGDLAFWLSNAAATGQEAFRELE